MSIELIVAIIAIVISSISLLFAGIQTRSATKANKINQQLEKGNAVIHFTSRFFDLAQSGNPDSQINNPEWAYQFWSLHATEFYFFHHGILPEFIYTLWMIDLSESFSGSMKQQFIESQKSYLATYTLSYPLMADFFGDLQKIVRDFNDEGQRNRKVAEFVSNWIKVNRAEL
ncbi:hypothetical protein [Candidatus Leptofilum sp.]|uniref:hypothetical protein n=1 Tax=Candidatus Leptofilum sp. TaxID=3241576 RepID=UPI003B5B3244